MAVRHPPRHARASLLTTVHRPAGIAGLAALAGLAVAVCAALAGGSAGAAPAVARPGAPMRADTGTPSTAAADAQLPPAVVALLRGATTSSASRPVLRDIAPASALALDGIPATALQAYRSAAAREARRNPACGLSWPLLAAIGRVESDHGRFAGAVLHSDGLSTPRVIGIPLDGHGTALIRDTDRGRLDGDTVYDRAVGPMQFIPSTWAGWGVDANGDGVADPFNVFDAAAAAADYLCAAGRNLTTLHGQVQAVLSYNASWHYVVLVLSLERVYASGVGVSVPILPTNADQLGRSSHAHLPPVNPGPPRAAEPARPKPVTASSSATRSASAATGRTSSSVTAPSSSPACSPATPSSTATSAGTSTSASASSGASTSADSSSATPTPDPSPSSTSTSSSATLSSTPSSSPSRCP